MSPLHSLLLQNSTRQKLKSTLSAEAGEHEVHALHLDSHDAISDMETVLSEQDYMEDRWSGLGDSVSSHNGVVFEEM